MTWRVLNSIYSFVSPWVKIRKDTVELPSGVIIPDFYIEELPDWVNVIAITKEGDFLIEEQYRHGIAKVCFELCAGIIEEGETPLDAAKRELLEETGYSTDEWLFFGNYSPNASGCNNTCYTFIANNVKKVADQELDRTEEISLHLVEENEIKNMMVDGRITEAVMLASLWRFFANK